jgi:hypothetical protein
MAWGVGVDSLVARSEHGPREGVGSVARSIVGDDPLDSGDAVHGDPHSGSAHESDCGSDLLVWKRFGVGKAGVGGRVFVHGKLAYAWDAGDFAARQFAAVSLMRIKAATQFEVAEVVAVKPASMRRWETRLSDAGVAGLLAEPKDPKRRSKLTADTVAAIRIAPQRFPMIHRCLCPLSVTG